MHIKLRNAIRVSIRKLLGLSVSSHWVDLSAHSPGWDERTKLLVQYIPTKSRVIEFGAGRQVLARLLPPGCHYKPSDLTDRGNGTLVLDLNSKTLPVLDRYDYAVMGGVLEYVHNVPRLLTWLSTIAENIVLSYAPTDSIGSVIVRRGKGWINDYSIGALVKAMDSAGYKEVGRSNWQGQIILAFTRNCA